MDYQICDLAPADLGAAVQLLEALRPLPDSAPMEIAQFISDVNDGAIVVVALVNSSVVGLVSARVAGDRAWTQLVAISPQWRRKGIGSALARGLVCATNFVETIDPAVMRPGRFDLLIGIGPPDQTALTALWERALATMTTESGVDAAKLAAQCHGFTPGDVDLASQRAAAEAFARARATGKAAVVTNEDLTAATNRTKASITPEMLSAYQAEVSMFERV